MRGWNSSTFVTSHKTPEVLFLLFFASPWRDIIEETRSTNAPLISHRWVSHYILSAITSEVMFRRLTSTSSFYSSAAHETSLNFHRLKRLSYNHSRMDEKGFAGSLHPLSNWLVLSISISAHITIEQDQFISQPTQTASCLKLGEGSFAQAIVVC